MDSRIVNDKLIFKHLFVLYFNLENTRAKYYMDIIPFEQHKITTMTIIIALNGSVNSMFAFQLLPVTRIQIYQTRETSKCKLPHCKIPGSILSMRYLKNTRGVIRSKSSPFKNAVTIDVSTTRKNISIKLSAFSIQMCGASSKDDGIEAATHIIDHLKRIQHVLNKIQDDMEGSLKCINWVKENTRGEKVDKPQWEVIECDNALLRVYNPIPDFSIVKPTVDIPEDLNIEVTQFLLSLCDDFLYHSDMMLKLDYIPNIHTIIENPLEIKSLNEAMVNYNYTLGFEVDRTALNLYIDGQNGFISRYNNALSNSVTIELPYEPSEDSTIKRRKNKIPHQTFLVYRSGSVTQSGPGGELMRDAYYLFMETIAQLRSYIEYKSNLHLEYQPVNTTSDHSQFNLGLNQGTDLTLAY